MVIKAPNDVSWTSNIWIIKKAKGKVIRVTGLFGIKQAAVCWIK